MGHLKSIACTVHTRHGSNERTICWTETGVSSPAATGAPTSAASSRLRRTGRAGSRRREAGQRREGPREGAEAPHGRPPSTSGSTFSRRKRSSTGPRQISAFSGGSLFLAAMMNRVISQITPIVEMADLIEMALSGRLTPTRLSRMRVEVDGEVVAQHLEAPDAVAQAALDSARVLATHGDSFLGGDDLDLAIAAA